MKKPGRLLTSFLLTGMLLFLHQQAFSQCGNTYTDTIAKIIYDQRDCREYPIEKIGSQWWMTENLDYLPSVVGPATGSETIP